MSNTFHIIKCIGAWGCLIGSVVCLVLIKADPLAWELAIVSLAFSMAPEA